MHAAPEVSGAVTVPCNDNSTWYAPPSDVERRHPHDEYRDSMIMSMGAYLGELLVRHGGGRWMYERAENAAVVEMPNGLSAYPHGKVAKRLDYGSEHNLFLFYWYALTRDTPPGTTVRVLPDPAKSEIEEPPRASSA